MVPALDTRRLCCSGAVQQQLSRFSRWLSQYLKCAKKGGGGKEGEREWEAAASLIFAFCFIRLDLTSQQRDGPLLVRDGKSRRHPRQAVGISPISIRCRDIGICDNI